MQFKKCNVIIWAGLSILSALYLLTGCHSGRKRSARPTPQQIDIATGSDPLLLRLSDKQRATYIVEGWRVRLMRRYVSLDEIVRVSKEIRPIVEAASRQTAVQAPLRRISQDLHENMEATRRRWVDLQEADLLLESGGDPDAISTAKACGVAQWLASTARGQGLKVDAKRSQPLSAQIEELDRRIAWLRYLILPAADHSLPGASDFDIATAATLPALLKRRELLAAERRSIDARFEARQAIFAQTRFLLRLYARFPGLDWLFQAYHGGEGGVTRLLKKYTGASTPASHLIRQRARRNDISFERVYLTTSPRSHAAAFAYLYGRSDDDRHYWWKLLASEQELAAYRKAPKTALAHWEKLLPGRRLEALWVPSGPEIAFADLEVVQQATHEGVLTPIRSGAEVVVRDQPLDPAHKEEYSALRLPTIGALHLISAAFRKSGGRLPLTAGDLILTEPLAEQQRAQDRLRPRRGKPWPPDPRAQLRPIGGPPPEFNYHTTGWVFDLLLPTDRLQRETLEYALGCLEERRIIAVTAARDNGELRFHICPNPRYGKALAEIGKSGVVPDLPGI